MQYYLPNAVLGGLLYPLSVENDGSKKAHTNNIFENETIDTGFIIDGVFVEDGMSEQEIINNEHNFLTRLDKIVNKVSLN
jgi:hypothetical protein